jgi:hypothetical protein
LTHLAAGTPKNIGGRKIAVPFLPRVGGQPIPEGNDIQFQKHLRDTRMSATNKNALKVKR